MDVRKVIIKPIITEHSMGEVSKGKFTFAVADSANKENIKNAVEKLFSVTVLSVSTSRVKGKKKRFGAKRTIITTPTWKKAVVKLPNEQKIPLFGSTS